MIAVTAVALRPSTIQSPSPRPTRPTEKSKMDHHGRGSRRTVQFPIYCILSLFNFSKEEVRILGKVEEFVS